MKAPARRWTVDRLLLTICAIVTMVGAFWADVLGPFAAEQIFNPRWPPHAKFHDAQYICMSVLISGVALVLIWRRDPHRPADRIIAGAVLASPWLGMFGALLFPGTAMFDPEFDKPSAYVAGLHPQIWAATMILGVIAIAMVLAVRRNRSSATDADRAGMASRG